MKLQFIQKDRRCKVRILQLYICTFDIQSYTNSSRIETNINMGIFVTFRMASTLFHLLWDRNLRCLMGGKMGANTMSIISSICVKAFSIIIASSWFCRVLANERATALKNNRKTKPEIKIRFKKNVGYNSLVKNSSNDLIYFQNIKW